MKMKKTEKMKRAVMMTTAETKKKKFLKKKKTQLDKSQRIAREKNDLYVPMDMVSEILLRLPARSLGKFRCVSKSWLSITSNTAFVRANAQHNRITRHSLIIGGTMRSERICLVSAEATISEFSIRLRKYHPNYSCYAIASCDGLVCVSHDLQYYVINPLTGQSIALPRDGVQLNCKLGFYFHHSTSKYRLIRFRDTIHESEVLVVGESSWRRIPDKLPGFFHSPRPLDLNRNLYWTAYSPRERRFKRPSGTVVSFDKEEEVYSVISLPPLEKFQDIGGHLIDFNGELGLWVVGNDYTIDVWIMENLWIKRYSVNYDQIHRCPCSSELKPWLILGGGVAIGDEELFLSLCIQCAEIKCKSPRKIFRCNLKSGACVMQHLMDRSSKYFSSLSYTETLTNPNLQHPHDTGEDP